MSSRKRNSLIMLIVAAVLGVAVIVSAILLIVQRVGGLESIRISPSFAEVELDVNKDYYVSIATDPEGGKIEKFEFISDSSAATFEYSDDGTGVIHTNGEGEITIYVKYKGVESNKLNYKVVDLAAAAAAQAQAEAEAAAAAEAAAQAEAEAAAAEAEAQTVVYVRVTKDSVNVRAQANTDCDIVGKASKGSTFEVIAVEGEWTQIKYSGDTVGYIRNDMIETVTDEQSTEASAETAQPTEEKKEETAQTQEKTEEQKKAEEEAAKKAEEDAAKKAEEDAAKKAADEQAAAQKAAEDALAAQQAAAAAAAATASAGSLPASGAWNYQGTLFSAAEVAYFHSLWDYTGDAAEMVTHHSVGELIHLCEIQGLR